MTKAAYWELLVASALLLAASRLTAGPLVHIHMSLTAAMSQPYTGLRSELLLHYTVDAAACGLYVRLLAVSAAITGPGSSGSIVMLPR